MTHIELKAIFIGMHLVLLVGFLQAGFVLGPLVIPSIGLLIRKLYPNSGLQQLYYNENMPFMSEKSAQIQFLCSATLYLMCAAMNNFYYTKVQVHKQKMGHGTEDEKEKLKLHLEMGRIWAKKIFWAYLFHWLLWWWMLLTTNAVIQLVLLLIVAMTVDPYRPMCLLVAVGTAVGYGQITVNAAMQLREQYKDDIRKHYLERHSDDNRQSADMLQILIHEKLEKLGLSFRSIALSLAIGVTCVLLILAVVALAQGLLYSNEIKDVGSLISIVAPCFALLGQKQKEIGARKEKYKREISDHASAVVKAARQVVRVEQKAEKITAKAKEIGEVDWLHLSEVETAKALRILQAAVLGPASERADIARMRVASGGVDTAAAAKLASKDAEMAAVKARLTAAEQQLSSMERQAAAEAAAGRAGVRAGDAVEEYI